MAKKSKRKQPTRRRRSGGAHSPTRPLQEISDLLDAGRFEEARGPLAHLVYNEPLNDPVAYSYVQCLLELGRGEEAVEFLSGPGAERPVNSTLWAIHARALCHLQQYEAACRLLEPRWEQQQCSNDELSQYLLALLAQGKTAEARAVFEQAADPNTGFASEELICDYALCLAEFGHADDAQAVLREALGQLQQSSLLTNAVGLIALEFDQFTQARESFEELVQRDDSVAAYWYHLGVALKGEGKDEAAADAYRRALSVDETYYRAWTNLGILYSQLEQRDEALKALHRVVELRPNDGAAWHRLGYVQRLQDQGEAAIHSLRQAVRLQPTLVAAWELLIRQLHSSEQFDDVHTELGNWRRVMPGDAVAAHLAASLGSEEVPTRASSEYIEAVFDDFADSFEQTLERLEYNTPAQIGQVLQERLSADESWRVLDAGCGTGLVAPYLCDFAKELIGVDLSSGMLDRARKTELYDSLIKADLVDYLKQQVAEQTPFDMIVAADTLNYFGDLSEIMSLLIQAIRPGGHLLFTVEEGPLMGDEGYYLKPHGRYAHAPPYIIEQMGENGIPGGTMRRIVLRKEDDKDVTALLALCQIPDPDTEEDT